ncbi:MAG: neutral zinc metallopeptidase [Prevotella sp.]|nr:neutral zinc metallopeptidase [Prevotella sp.]MBQ4294309.1 neutral zinc metallopeptidase [Prevotella sp.]MBR7054371.1 neutral zinc metallopeptidase [Prevotella sp.]
MDLDGRRESENFEDRRGMSGSTMAGMGIGGMIIIGLITLLMGGNPLDVIQQTGGLGSMTGSQEESTEQTYSPEEEAQVKFCKQILASTEDVWSAVFRKEFNAEYTPPTLVIFKNSVQTNCGGATSAVGPFYCSADQKLYLDLAFFKQMETQLKSGGDFARAYVIAHEVGHHVENLVGILGKAHSQMQRLNSAQSNQISVRLELLADYYAGVWAHYEDEAFGSLDETDMKEAINCAQHIGDNYLQEQAQGYSQPESFTHGTSDQRMRWLKRGYKTGDMRTTTFSGSYSDL